MAGKDGRLGQQNGVTLIIMSGLLVTSTLISELRDRLILQAAPQVTTLSCKNAVHFKPSCSCRIACLVLQVLN